MAERTYYLAFRRIGGKFYAIDKDNYLNVWNKFTGVMESRDKIEKCDLSGFELDRKVYDKGWFNYSLIYK
jgi:hypothetical protein